MKNIWRIINTIAPTLARKKIYIYICVDIRPWTVFCSLKLTFFHRTLSENCSLPGGTDNVRWRTFNIRAYFCVKWRLLFICFSLALTFSRVHPSSNLFVFVSRERLFLVFMSPSASRATLTEVMVPTFGKGRLCDCTLQRITNLQTNNQLNSILLFILHSYIWRDTCFRSIARTGI